VKLKSLIAVSVLVAAAAGAYLFTKGDDGLGRSPAVAAPGAAPAVKAPPVEVASARSTQASTEIEAVGTLSSDEAVSVAAEIAGRIATIAFKEGESVKAGDVLVKLDDALARAELAESEAGLKLAQANFERATSLSKSGAGTQRARDEALAALDTSRAAIELARVRLEKMEIRAPFDGVVGLRAVSVGAYAQIGQALVNLEKIDTLKLDFRLPEIYLRDIAVGQKVEVRVDAIPDRMFEGTVYAIDPMLDVNGRALKIRARLPNKDGILRPGLFARVKVIGQSRGAVVVVPEGAIVPRGTESVVFTVEDGKAVESKVSLGRRTKGEVEILDGLQADSTVVTAGHQRVRNGQPVEVVVAPGQPG